MEKEAASRGAIEHTKCISQHDSTVPEILITVLEQLANRQPDSEKIKVKATDSIQRAKIKSEILNQIVEKILYMQEEGYRILRGIFKMY